MGLPPPSTAMLIGMMAVMAAVPRSAIGTCTLRGIPLLSQRCFTFRFMLKDCLGTWEMDQKKASFPPAFNSPGRTQPHRAALGNATTPNPTQPGGSLGTARTRRAPMGTPIRTPMGSPQGTPQLSHPAGRQRIPPWNFLPYPTCSSPPPTPEHPTSPPDLKNGFQSLFGAALRTNAFDTGALPRPGLYAKAVRGQ